MPVTHIETHTNKKTSSPQQHITQTRSPAGVVHHPASIIQRAQAAPESLSAADVLQLQRTIGNRAVGQLMSKIGGIPPTNQQAPVQRQAPEEEEELMQGKFDPIQRQGELEDEELLQGKFDTIQQQGPEEEELLQGKFTGECIQYQAPEEEELMQAKFASGLTGTLQAKEEAPPNKTGMPDHLKSGLENISGMNLSGVRVQYNSPKPAQLNALAYTQGQEIHVGSGQEKHLPHEGWHVVQQMQGRVKPTMQAKGVSINDDTVLEHEAEVMGAKAQNLNAPPIQGKMEKSGESGEVVQRISWEALQRISLLGDAHKLKLAQIIKDGNIVPADTVQNIFTKLVTYGHTNFAYESGMSSFKPALLADSYNCESISHLLIHLVVIMKGNAVALAENVTPDPLVYNGDLAAGGFNNQDTNVAGQDYLVFTGGHTMANIDGTLYDPTTGVVGGMNDNYIRGTIPNQNHYRFSLGGIMVNMRRVDALNVIGGLYELEIFNP